MDITSEDPKTTRSSLNSSLLMHILHKEALKLEAARNKDLVIVLGCTGSGKSTLIYTLNGAEFESNYDGTINLVRPNKEFEERRILSHQGVYYADYPTLYHSKDSKYYYLDTVGSYDVRPNQTVEIISSLLLETVMKNAKSVRIILLSRFDMLRTGISGFDQCCNTLSKIVNIEEAKLYFLFNQYRPPYSHFQDFMRLDEPKQNEVILHEMNDYCKQIVSQQTRLFQETVERCIQQLRHMRNKRSSKDTASSAAHSSASSLSSSLSKSNPNDEHPSQCGSERVSLPAGSSTHETFEGDKSTHKNSALTGSMQADFNDAILREMLLSQPNYKGATERLCYAKIMENSFQDNLYGYVDIVNLRAVQRLKDTLDHIPTVEKNNLSKHCVSQNKLIFDQHFERILLKQSSKIKKLVFSFTSFPIVKALLQKCKEQITLHENNLNTVDESKVSEKFSKLYDEEDARIISSIHAEQNRLTMEIRNLEASINRIEEGPEEVLLRIPFKDVIGPVLSSLHTVRYPNNNTVKPIKYTRVEEKLSKDTKRNKVLREDEFHFEVDYISGGTEISRLLSSTESINDPALFNSSWKCENEVILYTKPEYRHADYHTCLKEQKETLSKIIKSMEEKWTQLQNVTPMTIKERITAALDRDRHTLEQLTHIHESISETMTNFREPYPQTEDSVYRDYLDELRSYEMIANLFFDDSNVIVNQFLTQLQRLFELTTATESTSSQTVPEVPCTTYQILNDFNSIWSA